MLSAGEEDGFIILNTCMPILGTSQVNKISRQANLCVFLQSNLYLILCD